MMNSVGMTTNNNIVIDGSKVFKFVDTYGIPLDLIVERFKEESLVVDWEGLSVSALAHGWTINTVYSRVKPILLEFYDKAAVVRLQVLLAGLINGQNTKLEL